MGSSFTEFKGYGFWSRDPALEVWLYLLVREIDKIKHVPDWLESARHHWYECATVGFIGWIHADLDVLLLDQERIETVIELAENAMAWIRNQGSVLDKDELNAMGTGGPDSYFTSDADARTFLGVGQAFVELLRGEWMKDASTSPMLGG